MLSEMVIQTLGEVFQLAPMLEKGLPGTEGQLLFSSRYESFICEREVRFNIHPRIPPARTHSGLRNKCCCNRASPHGQGGGRHPLRQLFLSLCPGVWV